MKKILLGLLITTAFALPAADTVMAVESEGPLFKQPILFRKAKAYRREVLKQELKTELYGELGTKLDKDVAVAANEIRTALQTQVAQESKKLQNQAAGHAKTLTAGNNAFQTKLTADNNKFHNRTVAEANKFREELNNSNGAFQQELTKANQQLRKRFVTMYKKANQELAATNKAQAAANAKLIAELSTATGDMLAKKVVELGNQLAADNQAAVAKEVEALVVKIDKELVLAVAQAQQSAEPAPEPVPEPAPEQQNAVAAEPTVVKDDDTE